MSGVYIFYISKTVKFLQYCRHWTEFGVLFGVFINYCKIGKTIAKRKTSLELTLKVTIV
jgi:hypothetical protein